MHSFSVSRITTARVIWFFMAVCIYMTISALPHEPFSETMPGMVSLLGSGSNMAFTRRASGIIPLDQTDPYGRQTLPGGRTLITERRMRRWATAKNAFFHRVRNGIHDPFTFFHVTETLLTVLPRNRFSAAELADHLNETKPVLAWDAVTVGRVLNDIRDSFRDANNHERFQPIVSTRHWTGTQYEIADYPEARAGLIRLVDDLVQLGTQLREAEDQGEAPKRLASPLAACPSLMGPLRRAAADLS